MLYKEFQDNIAYFFIIPFILLSVALTTMTSGAIVEKTIYIVFILVGFFLISRKVAENYFLIPWGLLTFFTLTGLIHYFRYEELGHVMLPISFFIIFYIGLVFPYKNNFIYILVAVILSVYFSYLYFNSFAMEMKYGRFHAKGFDINYLGFIFNYLFLIVVFYLKEHKKNIIMYALLLLLLVLGLVTSSRGTLISFIFGISLLLYDENKKTKLLFFSIVFFLITLYISINYEMVEALMDRFMNPAHRDELASAAVIFYLKGDLFNLLFGNRATSYFEYAGLVTHNDQLRILINYGAINLTAYMLMYFFIIANIYRYTKKEIIKEKRIYGYFILMMIAMYLFRGNFSNFFPSIFIFYFIGSFYGMKYHKSKYYKKGEVK